MFLIGIAGGSGSGKTTFAKKIIQRLSPRLAPKDSPSERNAGLSSSSSLNSPVSLLHQDSYYLPFPPSDHSVHGAPNFDHPDSFDWALLRSHLTLLKNGERVQVPVYDFKTSLRLEATVPVGPCKAMIMEGIFTLWDSEVRDLFDLKIYLNVDADIRFIRRLHRDVRERGRTLDGVIRQYYDTVRPMHHEFLEPTQQYADLIVGEESDRAAEVVAAQIHQVTQGWVDFGSTASGQKETLS